MHQVMRSPRELRSDPNASNLSPTKHEINQSLDIFCHPISVGLGQHPKNFDTMDLIRSATTPNADEPLTYFFLWCNKKQIPYRTQRDDRTFLLDIVGLDHHTESKQDRWFVSRDADYALVNKKFGRATSEQLRCVGLSWMQCLCGGCWHRYELAWFADRRREN